MPRACRCVSREDVNVLRGRPWGSREDVNVPRWRRYSSREDVNAPRGRPLDSREDVYVPRARRCGSRAAVTPPPCRRCGSTDDVLLSRERRLKVREDRWAGYTPTPTIRSPAASAAAALRRTGGPLPDETTIRRHLMC